MRKAFWGMRHFALFVLMFLYLKPSHADYWDTRRQQEIFLLQEEQEDMRREHEKQMKEVREELRQHEREMKREREKKKMEDMAERAFRSMQKIGEDSKSLRDTQNFLDDLQKINETQENYKQDELASSYKELLLAASRAINADKNLRIATDNFIISSLRSYNFSVDQAIRILDAYKEHALQDKGEYLKTKQVQEIRQLVQKNLQSISQDHNCAPLNDGDFSCPNKDFNLFEYTSEVIITNLKEEEAYQKKKRMFSKEEIEFVMYSGDPEVGALHSIKGKDSSRLLYSFAQDRMVNPDCPLESMEGTIRNDIGFDCIGPFPDEEN